MPVSRRGLFHLLTPPPLDEIRISGNENPLGPGRAVLEAMRGKFPEAGRYPFNSTPSESALADAIAGRFRIKPENVVLGGGSQELLKNAVRAFTSPERSLVTAAPSFENCPTNARRLGHPVIEVPVDPALRIDLDATAAASRGAGLIYFNNPNNPTATVHDAKAVSAFVQQVRKLSPDTVILVDEAYHDYVTDASYRTAVPLAMETPNMLVTRTFSKAYGMAGMRVGYAIGRSETLKRLAALKMPYNVSVPGIAAALIALGDQKHIDAERARNTEVRAFTIKALSDLGCQSSEAQTNFIFTNINRPAKDFRAACAKQGVLVGRDFPPFERTHVRISIGTMDEMRRAVAVFRSVLKSDTLPASGDRRDAETTSC